MLSQTRLSLPGMKQALRVILWSIPLLCQSHDVLAWGLYTHVFFAQWLTWGVPLLDPKLRRAALRYPKLVMAGACLPDLALVGRHAGTRAFNNTHDWHGALRMMREADTDMRRALALGFQSHLLVDVIAHHHFVPAHEHLWINLPVLTHAASEWAMDAHIQPHLLASPSSLLHDCRDEISPHIARHFGVDIPTALRALKLLARADGLLRSSRLPQLLYRSAARLDGRLSRRFDYFVAQTTRRLGEINQLNEGCSPLADANGGCPTIARDRLAYFTIGQIRRGQPLPRDCFYNISEAMATIPPNAMPASTSVG
ncbi:MAG: zinc dependent phospholipase C family protein [Sulfuriferula sp.]